MALAVKCPHCKHIHQVGPEVVGKRVTCGACKKTFQVPDPSRRRGSPPPPPEAQRPWSLHVGGQTRGPFAREDIVQQIKDGRLDATAMAWKDGMADWKRLGELGDFREAFAAAREREAGEKKRAALAAAVHGKASAAPREARPRRHRRYVPGRGRRDVVIGAWIAGLLAVVALVVVLIVTGKREPGEEAPEAPPAPRVAYEPEPSEPAAAPSPRQPAAGRKAARAPEPKPKAPRPKPPGVPPERRLARAVQDIERRFPAIIEAHKKGEPAPIGSFIRYLRIHADALEKYDWGPHQDVMDAFIARLREVSEKVELEFRQKPWHTGGLGEGVDEKTRAEALRLYETEWLERWIQVLKDAIGEVRAAGLLG